MPEADMPGAPAIPPERQTARGRAVGPLAALPLFMNLHGRRALVAGDADGAAWKAELLAAAGAEVLLCAPAPGAALAALLARGPADGRLRHLPRTWRRQDFAGLSLAVCHTDDDRDAAAFAAAGRAAGVPVSLVDRPALSDVTFGSIVERGPVVVGISTGGAAPALAQAIRQRIETALPRSLGGWAAAARLWRSRITERLPLPGLRSDFWRRFADRALAGAPPPEEADMAAIVAAASTVPAGRVTLVGAGPGDAGQLTLDAVRALQSADVILFDDLVSDAVLDLARREARRMLVGKRAGRKTCQQADINALMLKLARQGRHVVRLKSGDPGIFGRGGEEIADLAAAGIPVAVVPGITAGVALAARLGISLTHRDMAHSVRFVTGHSRLGRLPDDLDWQGLADPQTTTLFYMAGRTAAALAARLLAEGLPVATPAVVAAAIGRDGEHVWRGDLAALAAGEAPPAADAPVLLAIGRVLAQAVLAPAGREPGAALPPVMKAAGA